MVYLINKNMNNKKNSFISSNKIIRFKLGSKAADVLAVLIYKYEYWDNEQRLSKKGPHDYFFISLNDLEAETGFSKGVNSKNIKLLKQAGLVHSIQRGLNLPNYYAIDKLAIEKYKEQHIGDFEKWQKELREKNESPYNIRKDENETSRTAKNSIQEVKKESATKNKSTKNKNTNTFTNQASLVNAFDLESGLEDKIFNLRNCNDEEKDQLALLLFNYLCCLVPSFKSFTMSEEDKELIIRMTDSKIEDYKLSSKIINNVNNIIAGQKENRFGSLFVGLSEMTLNYENLGL